MDDPEKLFDSRDVDPEVRDLLVGLRALTPERSGAETWAGMAARLSALPTVVPSAGIAAGSAAPANGAAAPAVAGLSKALALKLVAAAAVSALVGAALLAPHTAPPRPAPAANATPATLPPVVEAPRAAPATEVAEPEATAAAAAEPAKAKGGAPAQGSRLEAEASLVARVRQQLRAGDARGALATLSRLDGAFPRGALAQERAVLTVEALAAAGNTSAASRRARAFILAHPTSPHSKKLERFVEPR